MDPEPWVLAEYSSRHPAPFGPESGFRTVHKVQRYPATEGTVMVTVLGCIAPEKWGTDQRTKRRTVVLVIVLFFYAWLTTAAHLTALEAAGMVTVVGIAAGTVIDRVVDGGRPAHDDLSALLRLMAGLGRR